MMDARHSFAPLFFRGVVVLGTLATVLPAGAASQVQSPSSGMIIPPPAKIPAEYGKPAHQPLQSAGEPWKAHDDVTGHDLQWDCRQGTWMDLWTRRPVGYDAYRDDQGNIIPPPLVVHEPNGTTHQATQSPTFHDQAYDATTKEHFKWDAEKKTWKDDAGNEVGFQGGITTNCPPIVYPQHPDEFFEGLRSPTYEDYAKAFAEGGYESRWFHNWKAVSGNDPLVSSNNATAWSNGFGASFGIHVPRVPMYGTVNGYWATGLNTDAMLINGHRIHNDVTDSGLGFGILYPINTGSRLTTYAEIAAMWERNKAMHNEYNIAGDLFHSEDRSHTSWTGMYGLGATYWVTPTIGVDAGASYNGQFKSDNADENFKLSLGLRYQFRPPGSYIPPPPPAPGKGQ